jgi:hypothetical protein
MEILNLSEPFPHIIIHDFYNYEELDLIWEEFKFLNKPGKMDPPELTGDPLASPNKRSIFLDFAYADRKYSNILSVNRKIFNVVDKFDQNLIYRYLELCDHDHTMISYYEDGAYYAKHHDIYVISSITVFWEEPKMFSGGDLYFSEFEYTPKMNNNTMVIFPSFYIHEVTPVKLEDCNEKRGRYSINQFYSIRQPNLR